MSPRVNGGRRQRLGLVVMLTMILLIIGLWSSGWCWNHSVMMSSSSMKSTRFQQIKHGLKFYHEHYGNFHVPYSYIVPENVFHNEDDEIVVVPSGFRLGQAVSRIRNRGDFQEFQTVLTAMGFEMKSLHAVNFEMTIEAVRHFERLHGHWQVPSKFIVPNNSSWPEYFWGLKLGHRLHTSSKSYQQKLFDAGYPIKRIRDRRNSSSLIQIIRLFKEKYGHVNVPSNFVVPSDDAWPKSFHGIKLGYRIGHIRNRGDFPELREELDAMGFQWDIWRDQNFQHILTSIGPINNFDSRRFWR